MKETAEDKLNRKARDNLSNLSSKARLDYSIGRLKTFKDLLERFGWTEPLLSWTYRPNELSQKLDNATLKEYLSDRYIELATEQWLRKNPPSNNHDSQAEPTLAIEIYNKPTEVKQDNPEQKDYGFKQSPNELETAWYSWFQKKEIQIVLKKIKDDNQRAHMIVSSTGSGKTFMAGGIVRRLRDIDFHKGKTISPWPYIYITKASIVEQTKRVFNDVFKLKQRDCYITNIDQLRSTAGELWVNEEIKVVNGEEVYEYEWRDHIAPLVFLLDECQVAKNNHTSQSRIIQALAKVKTRIHLIWLSATPGAKVAEFKAFVLNCHLSYDLRNPLKVKQIEQVIDI